MDLNCSLKRIATIHQQHSLKCYLAIKSLKSQYSWSTSDWSQIELLVSTEEPLFDTAILKANEITYDTVPRRRHWVLSHAVYPHAYFAMQQWFENAEPDEIFDFYLTQCLDNKQYLSHNVSILFSFRSVWTLLKSEEQKLRFIERFCEFVTSTFYGNNSLSYKPHENYIGATEANEAIILKDCLSNPGFWGHNIIAFASIIKSKPHLSLQKLNALLLNLQEQCFWIFEDESDRPMILSNPTRELSDCALELSCRRLLLGTSSNLHQITLAESIVFLFKQNWVEKSEKIKLIDVIEHFAKS
ncbi:MULTISPECIES: hypothetical protein [Pseudoalteromonas]|uniref:Uncharacterized protein n=1 Tax=Pseudoalteromonas arctica TaxID=394751 RepID=A0A7Y0HEC1_9GAMM|nr:hypothetical protein [Pseudoalteromonas arctica]NMM42802.1 hypothetical protein [Pseudoalteromonas arctica]